MQYVKSNMRLDSGLRGNDGIGTDFRTCYPKLDLGSSIINPVTKGRN